VCGIACPDDFTNHYHSSKHHGECAVAHPSCSVAIYT
jgi:hypothetical protein